MLNVDSEIVRFWRRRVVDGALADAVRVTRREDAAGEETLVAIEDRFPRSPFAPGPALWRVTSEPHLLLRAMFADETCDRIQRARHKTRGRVLYCIDQPADEVLAGLSFHIDDNPRAPVIVTALGIRTDGAAIRRISLACAGWLLAYLVEVSIADDRPEMVGATLEPSEDDTAYRQIGFRPAAPPAGFNPSGGRFLAALPRRRSRRR